MKVAYRVKNAAPPSPPRPGGNGVVKAKDLRRLHGIKRHAPSARVVNFQVSLTQEDYDRLPEPEDDTIYFIVPPTKPPG